MLFLLVSAVLTEVTRGAQRQEMVGGSSKSSGSDANWMRLKSQLRHLLVGQPQASHLTPLSFSHCFVKQGNKIYHDELFLVLKIIIYVRQVCFIHIYFFFTGNTELVNTHCFIVPRGHVCMCTHAYIGIYCVHICMYVNIYHIFHV